MFTPHGNPYKSSGAAGIQMTRTMSSLVTIVSAVSGVAVLGALITATFIFNDINRFYYETMETFDEFKVSDGARTGGSSDKGGDKP